MRAAVMRGSKIVVDTVPDPEPLAGEILVRTLACGICGSDLHALEHGDLMVEASREAGAPTVMDLGRDVVMGHEFCAEILEYGSKTNRRLKPGTRVVHPALLIRGAEFHGIGYSNEVPGGFAERMVLSESMLVPVPRGCPRSRPPSPSRWRWGCMQSREVGSAPATRRSSSGAGRWGSP